MTAPDGTEGRLLLALDTSGTVGSVAIGVDGRILALVRLEHRAEHASRLVPAIDEALRSAALDRTELGGVVVGSGPGSFTGVRVAAATAKGLVRGLGVGLWPVNSLAAAAVAADTSTPIRYALFDARSDRVYGACYHVSTDRLEESVEPHAGVLAEVLDSRAPEGAAFLGDGAERHRGAIEDAGFEVVDGAAWGSLAEGLLGCVWRDPARAPVASAGGWEPTYLRGTSAVPS